MTDDESMLEGLLFNIAAPRTEEKKTSLDSGVQGCFPQDRRRGTRERERVCVCVWGGCLRCQCHCQGRGL
jgi:hypothetical protein